MATTEQPDKTPQPTEPASYDWHKTFEPHPTTKPEHRKRAGFLGFVFALLLAMGCGFLGGYYGANTRTGNVASQRQVVSSESQLIAGISDTVGPSVVSINVTGEATTTRASSLYEYYYGGGDSQPRETQAAGTGIIISKSGIIMTNRHVVPEGTTNVDVTLADGTIYKNVEVLGRTTTSDTLDIAFLKIRDTKGKSLTAAKLGDSDKMQVGDKVVAIGNALGQFQNSVTSGIISGYGRSVEAGDSGSGSNSESLINLFQTDAAINSGNSGGPLVNMNGEVIGINTAVAGNAEAIGFSIPLNDAQGLIKQVLATGKFERAYLGVRYFPLDASTAESLDIKQTVGAYVPTAEQLSGQSPVISGSPADKAGLKSGDVITAIAGVKIDSRRSLSSLLSQHTVGKTVKLSVVREGKTIELSATLAAAPTE